MLTAVKQRLERDKEEGFTLIELMVVLLIIAILLAIAIPTFLGARNTANARSTQENLRNALTAEQTNWTNNQAFATGLSTIEPSLVWDAAGSETSTGNMSLRPRLTATTKSPSSALLRTATATPSSSRTILPLLRAASPAMRSGTCSGQHLHCCCCSDHCRPRYRLCWYHQRDLGNQLLTLTPGKKGRKKGLFGGPFSYVPHSPIFPHASAQSISDGASGMVTPMLQLLLLSVAILL